ncbi:autophagy-related protein 13-domain-containing protein [Radiomyces spectabilis]|uniref:autophagy-related protein 13-domain-containing protein n=1 Tax=Radiomyces spectabilis TaxID=64574 RepID=UPI00221F38F3|nr:autophagy-related protein 13-domain-containing protein [Radiomyces spectabilis]KAI8381591.1 autophagy-related protein 13-domain-containing protein [Radiomyces spectabilis]
MQPRSYQPSPATSSGTTLPSHSSRNSKLDHIIQNFYTKTAQIIIQARYTSELDPLNRRDRTKKDSQRGPSKEGSSSTSSRKLNKWFNIATEDMEMLREDLKYWRSLAIHAAEEEPPPMMIDIYLDVSELKPNQALIVIDDNLRRNRVELGKNQINNTQSVERILIETWELSLRHPLPTFAVDLPNLYKRSIIFFRSLHSLVRLLPTYNLRRRLRKFNDYAGFSIGYRLASAPVRRNDEISLNVPIMDGDARNPTKTYEFTDILTPLGMFKLQVQYRKNCEFRVDDAEQDLSARFIDMDEHYFTPTMAKYQQEQRGIKSPRRPLSFHEDRRTRATKETQESTGVSPPMSGPPTSVGDFVNPREIVQQRQRHSSAVPYATVSSTTTRDHRVSSDTSSNEMLSRRASLPYVSPFKSPSLSSSPQADVFLPSSSRMQASSSKYQLPESGSFGRKIEFSSSFDKYRERNSPNRDDAGGTSMMRRWSRTSDRSSIHLFDESEDTDLEEFVRWVGSRHDLKMFHSRSTTSQMMESGNLSPTSDGSGSMEASTFGNSLYRSKKALSHFQNLREMHNSLSESLSSSIMGTVQDRNDASAANTGISPGSSSSSTGRSYQPIIPSPLHAEQTSASPVTIPRSYPQNLVQHRRHRSTQNDEKEPVVQTSPEMTAFSSYPQDTRHDELRRLCLTNKDTEQDTSRKASSAPYVLSDAFHSSSSKPTSLGNRRIERDESMTSISEVSGAAEKSSITASGQDGRTSMLDDDDSLVFKMSELDNVSGTAPWSHQETTSPMLFRTSPGELYHTTLNYTTAKSSETGVTSSGLRRRSSSSGHISRINTMAALMDNGVPSTDEKDEISSANSSKSDPASSHRRYANDAALSTKPDRFFHGW